MSIAISVCQLIMIFSLYQSEAAPFSPFCDTLVGSLRRTFSLVCHSLTDSHTLHRSN
jgi:hypothetical protein